MKKLIFLLILAVAFIGVMPVFGAAYPPGVFTLDMELSENSVHEAVVNSDSVPAAQHFYVLPAGFMALPNTIYFTGQPQGYLIKPIDMAYNESDYWLRL